MKRSHKLTLVALGSAVVVFLSPIAYSYMKPRGLTGIYEGDGVSCACGHTLFQYIDQTGCYDFVPSHGSKNLLFALRQDRPDEWVGLKNGTNSARFRIEDGEVYMAYAANTNWFKQERVYNLWRVWIPELLGD